VLGIESETQSDDDGAWITSRSDNGGVVVWGSGFAEMLELTPEQTDNLQIVIEQLGPKIPQEGIPPTRYQDNNVIRTKLKQVLTPEQLLKHTEMSFQAAGGLDSYHLNEQLLEVVNLTDAQKNQIRKIAAERQEERDAPKRMPTPPHENASLEERYKYESARAAAFEAAMQPADPVVEAARTKKYAAQIKAVLTPEQRAKAEKYTAEAPALVEKFMGKKQDASKPGGRTPYIYVPGVDSWRPGDPLPEGVVPPQRSTGRFPRGESQ
jgi:Spy/CpxP family protein refolding chaperone